MGSARNLSKRFRVYYSLLSIEKIRSKSKSRILSAILKYGYSKFSLEILEYCDPEKCIEREQFFLDLLNPEYNVLKIAGSSLGYKHTEETRAKISSSKTGQKHTEETLAKMSSSKTGTKHSEETRTKIALAMLGKKLSEESRAKMSSSKTGTKHSEETRAKIALSLIGEKNPMFGKARPDGAGSPSVSIMVTDLNTNSSTNYDSMSAAAKALGVS